MEHLQHGMERKWQRHYRETRTTIAVGIMLLGFCLMLSLLLLWPQMLGSVVFNSRLAHHLIISEEDLWTCNSDYIKYVVDEPSQDERLLSFFMFNVTNPQEVFERGDRPHVSEVGPFAYKRRTYKYDIKFDPEVSKSMTFKEYEILDNVDDKESCTRMFFRMDRDHPSFGQQNCIGKECSCKDDNVEITTINPNFMKVTWEETAPIFLGRLSSEVFSTIQKLLTNEFIEATKAHLVKNAMEEIYYFRLFYQIGYILNTAYDNIGKIYGKNNIIKIMSNIEYQNKSRTCNLTSSYNIELCPWNAYESINYVKNILISKQPRYADLDPNGNFPNINIFLNKSENISFLNLEHGISSWAGISYYVDNLYSFIYVPLNRNSFTMAYNNELIDLFNSFSNILTISFYGNNNNNDNILRSEIIIIALAYHINKEWIASVPNALENLIYKEWSNTFEPVSCSPLGHKCIWQWGHIKKMREKENMMNSNLHEAANMSYNLIKTIINPSTKASINPNNIEYDGNSAKFYNAYTYCSRIIEPKIIYNDCMDISYAQQAAYYDVPSGLFGVDAGISQINRTDTTKAYMDINDDLKAYYVRFGCDLSQLVYGIYRNSTTFHDEYVIRYINLHKDSSLTHTFSINNWDEIGIAQFAGGFITQAIVGVRALYEIVRDGMWRFGEFEYYKNVVEYSSWMTLQGFPHAWIYDIKNAKELLEVLASNTDDAVDFRAQLIRNHMTFIGNGKRFINEIGKKDEIVFIPENNLANFNCIGKYSKSCALLAVSFNSSAEHCEDINRMFQQCLRAIVSRNKWVTHCSAFETTITSPQASTIISCDYTSVDQNPHSYMRSRGNLLTKMLLDLVVKNVLNGGLWCQSHGNCKYNRGGMFITTTIKSILFDGYNDPSIMKYLNMKHKYDNISFECYNQPYDVCGKQNYLCDHKGLNLILPNKNNFTLSHNFTTKDKYFTPYFEISSVTGRLLWTKSINATEAKIDSLLASQLENDFSSSGSSSGSSSSSNRGIIKVRNPVWAAYPGLNNNNDIDFNKYMQCQKRLYGGLSNLFTSCDDTVETGTQQLSQVKNIRKFHGNSTIQYSNISFDVEGYTNRQFYPHLWKGFKTYPYVYDLLLSGEGFDSTSILSLFSKEHLLKLQLTQHDLSETYKSFDLKYPLPTTSGGGSTDDLSSAIGIVNVRRLADAASTYDYMASFSAPKDAYGMGYTVPKGMVSLQQLAGFPIFAGTPHHFGNQKWGGFEFREFTGLSPKADTQMSYVDYDPVSGRSFRTAFRQQVNIRVEKGPILRNVFSSQQRCISPTKVFSGGSGYGCFAYIPLLWFEDAKVENEKDFHKYYDHYVTRPIRHGIITYIGAGLGFIFLGTGAILYFVESVKRHKFQTRIFVD